MALAPGVRLGAYEVVALIGTGGMGEVYRARDSRLGRDVAVKVLPAGFSADPERLGRFEQEARSAAALNHPNILAVYVIGQHERSPYIVSELLEGQTLRDQLNAGGIPVRKAVEYAIQLAHGLAAAHEKGIVHRDLKPENVFVTDDGRLKILDFGLAKLAPEGALAGVSALPTTPPDTIPGMVLGTIGYMSPEQVRGLQADHRSDIFAFGAVLYEMLAGQRAFRGDTSMDTMSAILKENPPDLVLVERHIPPALGRIVDRCLEKNPAGRFQSTRDLAFALEGLSSQSESAAIIGARDRLRFSGRVGWLLAAVFTVSLVAVLLASQLRETPLSPDIVRFTVAPPEEARFSGGDAYAPAQAVSADGRQMVFRAQRFGGADLLWLRSFDSLEARPLPGTEGGNFPFWSPDNRYIGFFADGKLKKIEVTGGPAQTLCDAPSGEGATWNADGVIVFAPSAAAGLFRVSATGGEPAAVTILDAVNSETSHRWPQFLPDGRQFVFLAQPGNSIRVGSLDSDAHKALLNADSKALYSVGYLLFVREDTLMAQPFDPSRAELTGDAVPVADDIRVNQILGRAAFAVSESGVLTYRSGTANSRLVWFDRSGRELATVGEEGSYPTFELSPDGTRSVVSRIESSRQNLWVIDLQRNSMSRLTLEDAGHVDPRWSPDSREVIFGSTRDPERSPFRVSPVDSTPVPVFTIQGGQFALDDWSPDGRHLLYHITGSLTGTLWVRELRGQAEPIAVARALSGIIDQAQFAPDGRWIAYNSNESGRYEINVIPFPPTGDKWQISRNGGVQPTWRGDGRELYFLTLDGTLMAVDIQPGPTFQWGIPSPLFRTPITVGDAQTEDYAPASDGKRFFVVQPLDAPAPVTVVLNWTAGFEK